MDRLQTALVEKVWACGFCVNCSASWDDLTKHIWSHFTAGWVKSQWSISIYVQSLLQHSSVRFDWLGLIHGYTVPEWFASDVEELRSKLEWLRPDRKTGPVLARLAYDRIRSSGDHSEPARVNLPYAYDAGAAAGAVTSSSMPHTVIPGTSFMYSPDTTFAPNIEIDWSNTPIDESSIEGLGPEDYEWSGSLTFTSDIQDSTNDFHRGFDTII